MNVEPTQHIKLNCHLREETSSCLEWDWMLGLKSNWEWIFGRERSWSDDRWFGWNQDQ